MRYEGSVLSQEEIGRVHMASLRILEEVGVRVHGELALPLLAEAGALVETGEGADGGASGALVRMPDRLVERSVASAPRSFTFGARNPEHDYRVPSGVTRFAMDGTAAFMRDFATGERRYGTRQDTVDAMRVFQACDLSVMGWPPVAANDRPVASRPLHEFAAMLTTLSKHGQHELHRRDQAAYLGEILEALAGGRDAARERHLASVVYCPVAPLVHDGEMLDAYLELGEWDVPVTVLPMPVPGTTGPGSVLGNIALANAEALSSVVLFQLAHPGRPVQYGSAVGSMDFRSGAFLAGTPEMGIQSAALTTMGRFYGLPTMAAGCATDAHDIGAQACIEKLLTMLPSISAGADIVVGYGELDGDQTLVLEQILVDDELAHLALRLVAGVDGREGAELIEDIAEVGPGGNFLAQPSTRTASRSGEFFAPSLIGRLPYDAWVTAGRPSMYARAREQVQAILDGPVVDPVAPATMAAIDAILARADAELHEA
jgi:trimethylamine--corrinoid protein Co-methyltransferase